MLKRTWIIAATATFGLAGCLDTDGERAVVGAGAGVLAADALGTNKTGAAILGAAAGAFCDDAGVCN